MPWRWGLNQTAAELINQFGDLDSLLAGAEIIKQPKRRENLINFAEQARISTVGSFER